jgi:2-methylcitrate dehydratase PrpD
VTQTTQLANYVSDLSYQHLTPEAVRAAKRLTLDTIGVILPAIHYGPGRIITAYVADLGDRPVASVLGTQIRTSVGNAALANGTMAADMEQDDVHQESNLHAASVFVPAMLGVAEEVGSTGQEWMTALVAAYEVGCRISIAMDNSQQYNRGFHPTAVSGIFGATAGVAKLRGLSGDQVASAFGLAGCQAAGLLTWEQETEHYTKSFQSGVPARAAVTAVDLAARGYVGAPDTLDGPYNIFKAFSQSENYARLTSDLGADYEILKTGYKFYSCCRAMHSTVDVVMDLAAEHGIAAADVDHIDVQLPTTLAPMVDNNTLITHNLQYIVATALTDGRVTREQTSVERYADAQLRQLASRVDLRGSAELQKLFPAHWPSHVRMRLKDGREFDVLREDARGSVTMPVPDERVEEKFFELTSPVLRPDVARQVVKTVNELENVPSIRGLTDLIATGCVQ